MQFVTIDVWAEGTMAMLQNRATEEALTGKTRSNNPKEDEDPRDIAERVTYRFPNTRQLGVPGAAFARMLREAAGSHKAKGSRKSLKYLLPAAVIVLDELCPLFLNDRKTKLTDYEVDSRPVTIPATKGRVMRHRPRFNEWSVFVRLRINENILPESLVRTIFAEGLAQLGIGDFRPEKGGNFGIGSIVSWVADRPAASNKTEARARNGRQVSEAQIPAE